LVLGKKSGRELLISKLKDIGVDVTKVDPDRILQLVKEESIRNKSPVSDEVLEKIAKKIK
jgi:isopropylmalate/homocitrate/citramalate synthase